MDLPITGHDPVLLREVLDHLLIRPDATLVDCTLGRGGHARAICERLSPQATFLGLDADPRNLEFAQSRLQGVGCQTRLFHANFSELEDVLDHAGISHVDGILADLGISTNQLFESDYGMSFSNPMPLDMRIDPRTPLSAADIVNSYREEDLANVLYELAQEHHSRRIARKIVEARRTSPIKTTDRLADLIRSAIPFRGGAPGKIDPATKSFMALRMKVNDELGNLERLLDIAPKRLKTSGRFAVITFHSTEDRMVKQAFRSAEQTGLLEILTKKPLSPADDELAVNPRSRSAKLRVAKRSG